MINYNCGIRDNISEDVAFGPGLEDEQDLCLLRFEVSKKELGLPL